MINSPAIWKANYPVPNASTHKYLKGHVGVFSGGASSTGAARLAAKASLRIGAGLVTVLSPASALQINATHLTAIMLQRLNDVDELQGLIERRKINCLVIGPGLGIGEHTREIVCVACQTGCKLVLDADALTSFENQPQLLFDQIAQCRGKIILTPHQGEFSRLFRIAKPSSETEKMAMTEEAARQCGAIVVLKGHPTMIADGVGETVICKNGPPWLATAGSGDVLAGCIAGLLAQGMNGMDAAAAGVWMHGLAGQNIGPGLIAEDLDTGLKLAVEKLLES